MCVIFLLHLLLSFEKNHLGLCCYEAIITVKTSPYVKNSSFPPIPYGLGRTVSAFLNVAILISLR